ncbi:MAG: hypothetical protein Ct9H90mP30_7300 [Actinomycetota bacterium]|nr:MAG: hypothetical protein Ct9H90mP30_7300 [Actinomycetota bacterium]
MQCFAKTMRNHFHLNTIDKSFLHIQIGVCFKCQKSFPNIPTPRLCSLVISKSSSRVETLSAISTWSSSCFPLVSASLTELLTLFLHHGNSVLTHLSEGDSSFLHLKTFHFRFCLACFKCICSLDPPFFSLTPLNIFFR